MKKAFTDLLKVKTIITLLIVITMVILAVNKDIEPATFMTVAGSVVTYYFTKKEKNEEETK